MDIKVLGPGCARCKKTNEIVGEAVIESGVEATVETITDLMEISKYAVIGLPAVVVGNDVKCMGKVPAKEDVKSWLNQEG